MRKAMLLLAVMFCGCTDTSRGLSIGPSDSLTIDGHDYALSGGAVTNDFVQAGHFIGGTSSVPWVGMWLDAHGTIAGTHACAPDASAPFSSGSGVSFELPDGTVYGTGVLASPACRITVTALSPASVFVSMSGQVTTGAADPLVDFVATFTAKIL